MSGTSHPSLPASGFLRAMQLVSPVIRTVVLGGLLVGALFGILGVVLVALGAAGSETKILWFSSTNAGIAAILIGAAMIVLVVRRGLTSIDEAVRTGSARANERARLEDLTRRLGEDEQWSSAVQRSLWVPDMFQRIQKSLTARTRDGPATLDVFDINCLAPLHAGFEMFLELLRAGGRVRVAMLDPRSEAFAIRSTLERDRVGRIAAEEVASFHILADIIAHVTRDGAPCHLEVRLTRRLPSSAIVLVNVDVAAGVILANPYPTEGDKRGLAAPWYTYLPVDEALYKHHRSEFLTMWEGAQRVAPRPDLRATTDWPFVEQRG